MADAPVNARANYPAQAMLRIDFRQTRQPPPTKGMPRLRVEPLCDDKENAAHNPRQRITLHAPGKQTDDGK